MVGGSEDVGFHAPGRIDRHHGATFLSEAPCDVPAAGRDVEHLHVCGRLAPLDKQVEVRALTMRRALTERLGALRPDVGHAASSTARCAASSIVGSTYRFGGEASARMRRASSAFVAATRTTVWRRVF